MIRRLLPVTLLLALFAVPVFAARPAAAERAPVRLAFLGDSLTLGLHASSDERMYRQILARRIFERSGGEVVATVVQDPFGLTDDAVRRVPGVVGAEPSVVILEVGNHEVFAGPEQLLLFERRYEELLDALEGTGAAIIAGTTTWLNYAPDSREFRQALQMNQFIRDLCARRGIAVADLWTATVFRYDLISMPGEPSVIAPFDGDALHPNDAGHRVLADTFWNAYRRDAAYRALAAIPNGSPAR